MKNKFLVAFILLVSPLMLQAEEIQVGQLTGSSGTEVGAVPEKVRDQIVQLSKSIQNGAPQFMMVGQVEASGSGYILNGDTFKVTKDTIIYGDLKPGAYVEVRGELIQGKEKVASSVVVASNNGGGSVKRSNELYSSDPIKRAAESR